MGQLQTHVNTHKYLQPNVLLDYTDDDISIYINTSSLSTAKYSGHRWIPCTKGQ